MLDIDMRFKQGILFIRLNGILNGDTCMKLEESIKVTKLFDIYDKETLRMSGILFAPKNVKFDDKNLLRNVDGTAFAFFSIIPINQNIGMIKGVKNVDHNEYRIEFINKNIKFPTDENGNVIKGLYYDADGNISYYSVAEYDENGNMKKISHYYADGNIDYYYVYEYDENGNKT